jgi:hypothetical protein
VVPSHCVSPLSPNPFDQTNPKDAFGRMERPAGENSQQAASTGLPEYYNDIPISIFLNTPPEFRFPNGEPYIDLLFENKFP